jgi:hypothetical protein
LIHQSHKKTPPSQVAFLFGSEQVGVCIHAHKNQGVQILVAFRLVDGLGIDQDEIRVHVAVSIASPRSCQRVVFIRYRQRLVLCQLAGDRIQVSSDRLGMSAGELAPEILIEAPAEFYLPWRFTHPLPPR